MFRVQPGEWPRLLQFGLFGFLLQAGMGLGFSAGDAAFLSNVGADSLPLIFMLTPVVMLFYTAIFSYLLVRYSIDRVVELTLVALISGGIGLWVLIGADLPPEWDRALYFGLKLYLAMWYIALYSLFWNYTDAYFDIQDAKRLFPLFAAFCALGTASGALLVTLLAAILPMHHFFLVWAALALATLPLARLLQRRWHQIAEHDVDLEEETGGVMTRLKALGEAFGRSRYTIVFSATLFTTLLMTNLAEYQYSMVLQQGRSEAELAALFGTLYAAANLFNLVACLFLFNRLVARLGVRNVAFIQPLVYFAVFGYFFLTGGTGAAVAAFFAYHGVLTSIEYNNQNLLFNALPSDVKRPLRTVIEGLCEPLASFVAGGFLLYAATRLDMRELSGVGVIVGTGLIAIVITLRQLYPKATAANMRRGWMDFAEAGRAAPVLAPDIRQLLNRAAASCGGVVAGAARALLDTGSPQLAVAPCASTTTLDTHMRRLDDADPVRRTAAIAGIIATATAHDIHIVNPLIARLPRLDGEERRRLISFFGTICDSEAIPCLLRVAGELTPRDRRAIVAMLIRIGAVAIPRLNEGLRDRSLSYHSRAIAARALAAISQAQFAFRSARVVNGELQEAQRLLAGARRLERSGDASPSLALLVRAMRERVESSVDFVLELLAIDGRLPNFDLLIVSLHSANPKVRANAIETVESGIEASLFRLLAPLLRTSRSAREIVAPAGADLIGLLEMSLDSGRPIEMAAAAELLHRYDGAAFGRHALRITAPDMSQLVRRRLLALMALDDERGPEPFSVILELAQHPEVGAATLEALTALAEHAISGHAGEMDAGSVLPGLAGDQPFFIRRSALTEVASRYPDLALVILKSRDERRYAA